MPPRQDRSVGTWILGSTARDIVAGRAGAGPLKQTPHERRADALSEHIRELNRAAAEAGAAQTARLREARLARDAAQVKPERKGRKLKG